MEEEIYLDIGHIEFAGVGSDCGGTGFKIQCPECLDYVNLAFAQWWPNTCSCGYKYEVYVKGTKE